MPTSSLFQHQLDQSPFRESSLFEGLCFLSVTLTFTRSTPFFFESYNLKSSLVASRHVHANMLDFAAAHGIKPVTETFEFSEKGLQEAVDKLNAGKIRYRGVLVRE
jgi:D-arabinose 1-dehydrogenase-like Zn-dependent alcohol dehydrogenase